MDVVQVLTANKKTSQGGHLLYEAVHETISEVYWTDPASRAAIDRLIAEARAKGDRCPDMLQYDNKNFRGSTNGHVAYHMRNGRGGALKDFPELCALGELEWMCVSLSDSNCEFIQEKVTEAKYEYHDIARMLHWHNKLYGHDYAIIDRKTGRVL